MISQLKNLAKRLLAIVWIRKLYEATMRGAAEFFGAHRVLSIPYSILTFPTFNREQFAVLRGRRDYYRNLGRQRRTYTELRRNIHRLEKGISMQPRRSVFALDYLIETIEFYEAAVRHHTDGCIEHEELDWGFAVLTEYFSLVDEGNPVVTEAKRRFVATRARFDPGSSRARPYRRAEGTTSAATYQDLLDLALQRRSVRWFKPDAVPRDLVDKALLVGRQSPTACNRLPYEFRIFDDPAMVKTVAAVPFGSAGYSHQIPTIAVVVGRLSHYFSPRDRHVIYVDASLAAMGFMYALETLGLSSSVINWPDFEPLEAKMQRTLGLDYDERVIMLIAIGYADPEGLIPFSQKKPLDVLRRYNELAPRD
ncbi:nitroreductase family protein [Coralloluteibacterium stylophorae]|uniref:Nitroreductase family protein n=1 Tax=Coralloluteibacterium stylophorae TaxID=1776034 RepID=A0A8J7VUC9_9GAMM|nr:nitroreductase family protein [Coralloluteibacterium stylophorae]MBS7457813.1 nitroreductase family protein [Coralloluteibacterium stylophorae]